MTMLPSVQAMMIAVLDIYADNKLHKRSDLMNLVAEYFQLTEEQKKIIKKDGKDPTYKSRCSWILTYFSSDKYIPDEKAKLLERVEAGVYRITSTGLKCYQNKELFERWYLKYMEKNLSKWHKSALDTKQILPSTPEILKSTIQFLDKAQGFGYLIYNEKRYSIQKSHTDEEIWHQLEIGKKIQFKEFISSKGNLCATEISLPQTIEKPPLLPIEAENTKPIHLNELVNNHGKFYQQWRKNVLENIVNTIPTINATTAPDDFEDLVFTILKLLGINEIYQFPRSNQAGKPDGIFRIGNLIVLYDCTLRKDFQSHKDWQIDNFTNRLKDSKISITYRKEIDGLTDNKKKTFQLTNLTKHAWIITRGKTEEIDSVDDVCVKEICLESLLQLLESRLMKNYFNEESLVKALTDI